MVSRLVGVVARARACARTHATLYFYLFIDFCGELLLFSRTRIVWIHTYMTHTELSL